MNLPPALARHISPETRFRELSGPFRLESGAIVDSPVVAYRTWGQPNRDASNAVLVCHALTGSADVDAWWAGMLGPGRALDPERDFVVCSNVLGGCYGTSGPLSPSPGGNGRLGSDFPRVTVRDMVHLQARLLDALGIERLSLVIGPSLGGMQALEWAACYPERVEAIAPIGVSARHSAWCIGISEAQRQAIQRDPAWLDGHYPEDAPPRQGMAVARMMAMVSYRSWDNLDSRFGRDRASDDLFQVESYLRYQGDKLVDRFDAVAYVRLTQAMDSHDLGRGRGELEAVLAGIRQPALVVSVSSDVLYPPHEQLQLAEHMPAARYEVLDTPHGHDGFLIDLEELGSLVADFRRDPAPARKAVAG
ncbi:MAG: homoserine O-acetyltransferase [Gammaproteobacteria bacterium]